MIRTVKALIRTGCILFRACTVNMLPVKPFIKRTAVVKYAVNNDLHASFVNFFHQLCKKFITGFQILFIRYPVHIPGCMCITLISLTEQFSLIRYNHTEMRVYIIVVLYIIFMIGRRYKQRVKVNNLYP